MTETSTTQTKTTVVVDPKVVDAKVAELSTQLGQAHRRIANAERTLEYGGLPYYMERAEKDLVEAEAEANRLSGEIFETEAPYRQLRWSRFFLVQNNGGHIHSSMSCSTCNKLGQSTQFGWLPQLSGDTEADAVAAHGAILCTVCYPSAPVEWTNAHEVAKAARDAEKCAGGGRYLNRDLPNRLGYYSGNWGTCEVCGDHPAVTSTGKLRAHKPKAATKA